MRFFLFIFYITLISCDGNNGNVNNSQQIKSTDIDSVKEYARQTVAVLNAGTRQINTGNTKPEKLIEFAKTLTGTPYTYGSADPATGFDCSGFITYVFNHFNISVPRSSVDFTNIEREIFIEQAKPGDLILFTGTDSTVRAVGHMGIITSTDRDTIQFIHSTSGKAHGVTTTPLNNYYFGRFVKIIRVFKRNDEMD